MIKVDDLKVSCTCCPSAWEGTSDGKEVYIRYRWGRLDFWLDKELSYSWKYRKSEYDGYMTSEELKDVVSEVVGISSVTGETDYGEKKAKDDFDRISTEGATRVYG